MRSFINILTIGLTILLLNGCSHRKKKVSDPYRDAFNQLEQTVSAFSKSSKKQTFPIYDPFSTGYGLVPDTSVTFQYYSMYYQDTESVNFRVFLPELKYIHRLISCEQGVTTDWYAGYFVQPVYFTSCKFLVNDFQRLIFGSLVEFSGNSFGLNLTEVFFRGPLSFTSQSFGDTLNQTLNFESCYADKGIRFEGMRNRKAREKYGKRGYLKLSDNLFFRDCSVKGGLLFDNCEFLPGITLKMPGTKLDTLRLKDCIIHDTLNFENLKLHEGHKCEFFIQNTDISKLNFQYDNFHLSFPDSVLQNSKYADVVHATYKALLVNFENHRYSNSFQALDIEYKNWQSQHSIAFFISRFWWEYGYKKERILLIILLLLTIFSLINLPLYNVMQETYSVENLRWSHFNFTKTTLPVFFKKWQLSFFYTSYIFFKLGIEFNKIDFRNTWLTVILFIQYATGLICTGYLANFIINK